jgi:hypothetical protein
MKLKSKLLNPFVLVGQGFLVGALFFYTTAPEQPTGQPLPSTASVAMQQISDI